MHPTTADTTVGREKPIIFSGESVSAILAGRKTQTRRVVKLTDPTATYACHDDDGWPMSADEAGDWSRDPARYRVGDRLWVKETYRITETGMNAGKPDYKADDPSACGEGFIPFKSPLFMKRAYSRLTLEVTAMRVERLQEISEADCLAEGGWAYANLPIHKAPCRSFQETWDAINGKKYPWSSSPWVWVIEFKPVTP